MSALERGLNIYIGRSVVSISCGEISWQCSALSDSKDARRHRCLSQTLTDNRCVLFFFIMEINMKEWPWHDGASLDKENYLYCKGLKEGN